MELAQASRDLSFQDATLPRIGDEGLDRDGAADTNCLAQVPNPPDEQ